MDRMGWDGWMDGWAFNILIYREGTALIRSDLMRILNIQRCQIVPESSFWRFRGSWWYTHLTLLSEGVI